MVEDANLTVDPVDEAFDVLFATLLDPAVLIDPARDRFVAANPAALRFLGYDEAELREMSPADIHPHELSRIDAFFRDILREGRKTADDLSCRLRDGRTVPALIRADVVRRAAGPRVLIVIRDQRDHQLARLGDAVRQLAHDLKNALSTAQLVCDRLAAHEDDKVRLAAESMTRSLERATRLCAETAQASRTGPASAPERERFLLADVLEELEVTVLDPGSTARRLIDASGDAVILDADFDQTYRILLNLARNAFDAGARELRIWGRHDSTGATIWVRDDGPGLPDGIGARLQTEKHGLAGVMGTGLGLSIAAELCRGHGGALELEATGPEGTCFRVTLPAPA